MQYYLRISILKAEVEVLFISTRVKNWWHKTLITYRESVRLIRRKYVDSKKKILNNFIIYGWGDLRIKIVYKPLF